MAFIFEGNTVKGYRWNFPSNKRILIVHGFDSSIINFESYIPGLIEKGYEIIGFDAPAHGRSDGKNIDVLLYKNLILQICREFGPINSFLTHSFGGLALSLALESMPHTEDFKAVMIAPATETTTAIDNFFKFFKFDQDLRIEFDNVITIKAGHPPSWYSVARASAQIKAQVLFLQDEEDYITPIADVLPIINKGYPNFKFIITNGLGHSRIYKSLESINSVLAFL